MDGAVCEAHLSACVNPSPQIITRNDVFFLHFVYYYAVYPSVFAPARTITTERVQATETTDRTNHHAVRKKQVIIQHALTCIYASVPVTVCVFGVHPCHMSERITRRDDHPFLFTTSTHTNLCFTLKFLVRSEPIQLRTDNNIGRQQSIIISITLQRAVNQAIHVLKKRWNQDITSKQNQPTKTRRHPLIVPSLCCIFVAHRPVPHHPPPPRKMHETQAKGKP